MVSATDAKEVSGGEPDEETSVTETTAMKISFTQVVKRRFVAHSRRRYAAQSPQGLQIRGVFSNPIHTVLVLSPVTGPLSHHGANTCGAL